jgi:hypothetical protein
MDADPLDLWERERLRSIGLFIKSEREAQGLTHEALSEMLMSSTGSLSTR